MQNEGLPEPAPIWFMLFLLHFETKKAVFLLLTLQTLLHIMVLNLKTPLPKDVDTNFKRWVNLVFTFLLKLNLWACFSNLGLLKASTFPEVLYPNFSILLTVTTSTLNSFVHLVKKSFIELLQFDGTMVGTQM